MGNKPFVDKLFKLPPPLHVPPDWSHRIGRSMGAEVVGTDGMRGPKGKAFPGIGTDATRLKGITVRLARFCLGGSMRTKLVSRTSARCPSSKRTSHF